MYIYFKSRQVCNSKLFPILNNLINVIQETYKNIFVMSITCSVKVLVCNFKFSNTCVFNANGIILTIISCFIRYYCKFLSKNII